MADTLTDWRLFGAHDELQGATLWWRAYAPRNQIMAQEHCAFCWAPFARSGENVWHEGYATQAPYGAGGQAPTPAGQSDEGADDAAEADDDYITQVIAAVSAAAPAPAMAADEPAEDSPDSSESAPALPADALDGLALPTAPAEAPKVEAVYWICPQCFDDFQALFGWTVANAE